MTEYPSNPRENKPKETMSKYNILENVAISDTGFLFLPNTGETFTLNEQGREIFRLMQQKLTNEEIFEAILNDYDVERPQLERDFDDFFAQLKNYGLVKAV